jgi:hypothetical protein
MTAYNELLNTTFRNVRKARKISDDAYFDEHLKSQLSHRVALLFSLDVILNEYKNSLANCLLPIRSEAVLVHKIMTKYSWQPSAVRAMSLLDQLFAIADDLQPEKLPAEAQATLAKLGQSHPFVFPDIEDGEWEPAFAETIFAAHQRMQPANGR